MWNCVDTLEVFRNEIQTAVSLPAWQKGLNVEVILISEFLNFEKSPLSNKAIFSVVVNMPGHHADDQGSTLRVGDNFLKINFRQPDLFGRKLE